MARTLAFAAFAVAALAAVASARSLAEADAPAPAPAPFVPPAFCFGLDCPEFELVANTTYYEVRKYKPSTWVSTKASSPSMAMAMGMSFGRLLPYFGGLNVNGTKIPKGNPMIISASKQVPMYTINEYTIGIFLPSNVTTPLPAPILPGVEVQEVPAFTAYVATTPKKVIDEFSLTVLLSQFKMNLTADGYTAPDAYSVASYKAPKAPKGFAGFGKAKTADHNEVWLVDADITDEPLVAGF